MKIFEDKKDPLDRRSGPTFVRPRRVREDHQNGWSPEEIAEHYNMDLEQVHLMIGEKE